MKVLVSDNLSPAGINVLQEEKGIVVDVKPGMAKEELCKEIRHYDGLIVRSGTKVTADVIEAAKRLKVIARAGVGVDNIDVDAATKRGIIVMNAPTGNTVSTAEHTFSLLLALSRNVSRADRSMRGGKWERKRFVGTELYDKVLGIIGLGRVGTEVAKRAQAFGMHVLAYDPLLTEARAKTLDIEGCSLDDVIEKSDFITLHAPLTPETYHLLGAEEFARMKKGVRIINCARGGLVDEAALAQAIESGHVAGAALDVYEEEPPRDSPLLELDEVVLTPHLGASTDEAQQSVAVEAARQLIDALKGGVVRNALNMPPVDSATLEVIKPYISLAEKIGLFLGQFIQGAAVTVTATYSGKMPVDDLQPISRAVLRGFLEPVLPGTVNYVNANVLASERNIEFVESKTVEARDYVQLITLRVETDKETREIGGTLFGASEPHIVLIDGYRVDAVPEGVMLICFNEDKPRIIDKLGMLLGENDINIANMALGRKERGGPAVTVLNLDADVSPELLKRISKVEYINEARVVRF
ncbi:MAG: phosphoglycerate dehydrogenase [Candidatus Hydrogenedentes bacterium]|nr:phosphoglycerate dehydrogenase [Candidatus Hydrogenedentota bacterium]